MYFKSILVKYGEIGIKGKNRYLFEDALMDNIRFALQGIDAPFEVTKESGRILVTFEGTYDYEEAVSRLTKVFGIVHISPVVVLEDKSFDAIARTVGDYMEEYYGKPDFTFKVICKRADKHFPKTSMEAAADLGVDLAACQAAGGRIMKEDVLRAAEGEPESNDLPPQKVDPLRRSIAKNMTESWHTSPRVTYTHPVDMTAVIEMRKRLKPEMERTGIKISYNHILMKACARVLREQGAADVQLLCAAIAPGAGRYFTPAKQKKKRCRKSSVMP